MREGVRLCHNCVVAPPLQMNPPEHPQPSRSPIKTCKVSTRGSRPPPTCGIRRPSNHPSIRSKAGRERTKFLDLRRRPRYPRGGGNAHGIRGTLAALALIGSYALPITQRPNVMRSAHPRGGATSVSLGRDHLTLENNLKISQKVKRKTQRRRVARGKPNGFSWAFLARRSGAGGCWKGGKSLIFRAFNGRSETSGIEVLPVRRYFLVVDAAP